MTENITEVEEEWKKIIDPETGKEFQSKSKYKKYLKTQASEEKKKKEKENKETKQKELEELQEKKLEASKSIHITLDPKFAASCIKTKIFNCRTLVSKDVKVYGWCHRIRRSKNDIFVILRDGTDYLQTVISDKCAQTYDALTLTVESTICVWGNIIKDERAINGIELRVVYWEIVGKAPESFPINQEANPDVLLDQRHLALRGENGTSVIKLSNLIVRAFRKYYEDNLFTEIIPPTIVQTQCEGGSTLFDFSYYGEKAFLTQSSQLYLETAIPFLGDCYCIAQSYRAEKSKTRRHLAEFTHIEAELPFIEFEDLLLHVEDIVCFVAKYVAENGSEYLSKLKLTPKSLKKPFKRMTYKQCIDYCKAKKIYKDEEKKIDFEYGDDIPDGPERKMIEMIGEPVLMTNFLTKMKAFYMKKVPNDPTITESVDLLMPGVGEIVGGSMRIHDYEELMQAYKREELDPSPYYWFTDQRKYGTSPHGGYGLGLGRFVMWLCGVDHIRNTCLYPRYFGRCQP